MLGLAAFVTLVSWSDQGGRRLFALLVCGPSLSEVMLKPSLKGDVREQTAPRNSHCSRWHEPLEGISQGE
jgi:hypothetical protein